LAQAKRAESRPQTAAPAKPAPEPTPAKPATKKKMSYKEQRELDSLPGQIEALEARQAALNTSVNAADFYRQDPAAVKKQLDEVQSLALELEAAYQRWHELDALAASL
ncbi:MAG: ABC transporter ATP-binding protein, partial [Candidatus Methylumidiphilus sp.]